MKISSLVAKVFFTSTRNTNTIVDNNIHSNIFYRIQSILIYVESKLSLKLFEVHQNMLKFLNSATCQLTVLDLEECFQNILSVQGLELFCCIWAVKFHTTVYLLVVYYMFRSHIYLENNLRSISTKWPFSIQISKVILC